MKVLRMLKKFDPDQERDESGRWTRGATLGDAFTGCVISSSWAKDNEGRYKEDKQFKDACDAATIFSQGQYPQFRNAATYDLTGDMRYEMHPWSEENQWPSYDAYFDSKMRDDGYRKYFPDQFMVSASIREGAKALMTAIATAPPTTAPIYRAVTTGGDQGRILEMSKMKKGDVIKLPAPSSFTTDTRLPNDWISGDAGGAVGGKGRAVILKVLPGARCMPIGALSPYQQSEVLSQGEFEVVGRGTSTIDIPGHYTDIEVAVTTLTVRQTKVYDMEEGKKAVRLAGWEGEHDPMGELILSTPFLAMETACEEFAQSCKAWDESRVRRNRLGRFAEKEEAKAPEPDTSAKGFLRMIGRMMASNYNAKDFLNLNLALADHGTEWGDVKPGKRMMTPKRCFNNSITRSIQDGSDYTEGFVFVHNVPLAHAWVVEGGGKPVDYTIKDSEKWTYVGLRVPKNILARVATSDHFGKGMFDGILGTLNAFPTDERLAMTKDILDYNLSKGEKKFNPNQERDRTGRWTNGGLVQALQNQQILSRSFSGTVDLSPSAEKGDSMTAVDDHAGTSKATFTNAYTYAVGKARRAFKTPEALVAFFDEVATRAAEGQVNQLYRTFEVPKFGYTPVPEVAASMQNLAKRYLGTPHAPANPEYAIADFKQEFNRIHAYTDAVGRTTEILGAWLTERYGLNMPSYEGITRDEYIATIAGSRREFRELNRRAYDKTQTKPTNLPKFAQPCKVGEKVYVIGDDGGVGIVSAVFDGEGYYRVEVQRNIRNDDGTATSITSVGAGSGRYSDLRCIVREGEIREMVIATTGEVQRKPIRIIEDATGRANAYFGDPGLADSRSVDTVGAHLLNYQGAIDATLEKIAKHGIESVEVGDVLIRQQNFGYETATVNKYTLASSPMKRDALRKGGYVITRLAEIDEIEARKDALGFGSTYPEDAHKAKDQVVKSLADKLLATFGKELNPMDYPSGGDASTKLAQSMVDTWAKSSTTASDSAVLQIAATEVLRAVTSPGQDSLTLHEKAKSQFIPRPYSDDDKESDYKESIQARASMVALEHMRERTQQQFKDAGYDLDGTITAYRGVRRRGDSGSSLSGDSIEFQDNALSSWSIMPWVATTFCGSIGKMVITAEIPIKDIVSTPLTGLGCLNEYEMVVSNGGRPTKATIVSAYPEPYYDKDYPQI